MKDPRITMAFGGPMEPYYNSLTFDCHGLPDSGADKSQEVKLNFTGQVADLKIKNEFHLSISLNNFHFC